jgi:hypothetical protein
MELTAQPKMILRVKKGRKATDYPIETLNQASEIQKRFFNEMLERGEDSSSLPTLLIFVDGKARGYVSQNGKVWEGSPREWKPGQKPLFDPYAEVAS